MGFYHDNSDKLEDYADIMKALSHPVRLCIVRGLLYGKGCNVTKMQECLGIPQSTLSQHLSRLKASGVILGERNGLEINYRVENPTVIKIIKAIFAYEEGRE